MIAFFYICAILLRTMYALLVGISENSKEMCTWQMASWHTHIFTLLRSFAQSSKLYYAYLNICDIIRFIFRHFAWILIFFMLAYKVGKILWLRACSSDSQQKKTTTTKYTREKKLNCWHKYKVLVWCLNRISIPILSNPCNKFLFFFFWLHSLYTLKHLLVCSPVHSLKYVCTTIIFMQSHISLISHFIFSTKIFITMRFIITIFTRIKSHSNAPKILCTKQYKAHTHTHISFCLSGFQNRKKNN